MVLGLNPWLTRRAMPGKTRPLMPTPDRLMASMSMAAGCRCLSELILLPGQRGDPVSHVGGDRGGELGDLVRPAAV